MRKCYFCDIEAADEIVQCVHCGRWLELSASDQRFASAYKKESPKDNTRDMCDEGGICTDND